MMATGVRSSLRSVGHEPAHVVERLIEAREEFVERFGEHRQLLRGGSDFQSRL